MSTNITLPNGTNIRAAVLSTLGKAENADLLAAHVKGFGTYAESTMYGFDHRPEPTKSMSVEYQGHTVPDGNYGVRVTSSVSDEYGIVSAPLASLLLGELMGVAGEPIAPVAPPVATTSDPLTPDLTVSDAAFRNESVRATIFLEHGVKDGSVKVKAENVAGDRGGLTKYGISAKAYPNVDIANLTYDGAVGIYADKVWVECKASILPRLFAFLVFDFYTTSGGNAWRCLQRTVAPYKPSTYKGTWDDGAFGAATLQATLDAVDTSYVKRLELLNDFTTRRIKFYHDIVDNDASQKKFLAGWNKRAVWAMGYAQALLKSSNIL